MSKYISEFKSVNGEDYRVEIETSSGNQTFNLTLSGDPFITEMDFDSKQIYSPIKGSRATISFVMDDYIFDFYTQSPTGTTVTLTNENTGAIEWTGFVTPQMFSQSFELGLNEIQVEAVDALSVLENLKYKADNPDNKVILSFLSLFKKILKQVNVRYLYVSDNVTLQTKNSEQILDKIFISEHNFFDKKNSDETDDDVCWNCKEVIYEMCQFLGYVAVVNGQDVYLLDYDAIKRGATTYYRYEINSNAVSVVNHRYSHQIIGTDHNSNNANVSLDAVYNKVTVKADTYSFEDHLSSNEENITDTMLDSFSTGINPALFDYIWGEVFPGDEDQTKAMDALINAYNDGAQGYPHYTLGEHNYYDFVVMKFLNRGNTKFWLYNRNWEDITTNYNKEISFADMQKINGGIYVKYFAQNLDKYKINKEGAKQDEYRKKWKDYYNKLQNDPNINSSEYLDSFLDYAGITNVSWTEAIIMNNFDANIRPEESEWYKIPYYQVTCDGDIIQGGDNSALVIQGNYYWHPVGGTEKIDSYPIPNSGYTIDEQNWINPPEDMFIPASVQWGNYWWNGSDWQNTKCGFKLYWMSKTDRDDNQIKDKNETIDAWKVSKNIMNPQPITNTASWRFGTSDQGHLITIPKDKNFTGKPVLTLYRPVTPRTWKSRKDYLEGKAKENIRQRHYFVALLNFKFKSIMGDPSYMDINKSDTIYTNELENDSINEMEDINFKIHTFDNKQNTYSAAATNNGEFYIDKIYNRALQNEEQYWQDSNGEYAVNGLRAEEHLIFKLCKQYTTPAKVLECEIKKGIIQPYGLYQDTTLTGDFIVDSLGTNYRHSYNTVKLIEKK